MLLLQAKDLLQQYGTRTILNIPTLQIYEGDKIGIIGDNGAGKTTLLRVLSGALAPDAGSVIRRMSPVLLSQLDDTAQVVPTQSCGERQKTRIQSLLSHKDCVVFADEPTANLDGDGVRWVTRKLSQATTVLLISHDRTLLDSICTRIFALENGKLTTYTGNYSDYVAMQQLSLNQQNQAHRTYEARKSQLESAIQKKQQKVAHQRQQKRKEYANNISEARLGGHQRAASMKLQEKQAKTLAHRLEKLEVAKKVTAPIVMHLNFALTNPPKSTFAIRCDRLSVSFDAKQIFSDANFQIKTGETIALKGCNGSGKSTLLSLIATRDRCLQVTPKLKIGYLQQDFGHIDSTKTVLENAMTNSVQTVADVRSALAALLFRGETVNKLASVLSGGERMRLALGMLMVSSANCLLLDEPNNFLDIASLQAVTDAIKTYPGTILLVSHDARFVSDTADRTLCIENHKILEPSTSACALPSNTDRLLLDIRLSKLLAQISTISSETARQSLEEEYQALLCEKRNLPRGTT